MNEDMKRLITGGKFAKDKIVGYTWYLPAEKAVKHLNKYWEGMVKPTKELISIYSPDMEDWRLGVYGLETSFDIGIKVIDEWWFENDIIKYIDDTPKTLSYGEYVDTGVMGVWNGWYLKGEDYERGVSIAVLINVKAKRIGTIYDENVE